MSAKHGRAAGQALRVDHLAFPCFDAAATQAFYCEVLGFRLTAAFSGLSPEWGNKRYLMMMFERGDGHVHFFGLAGMRRPRPDGLPPEIRHVAFDVRTPAAVGAWKRRLVRHGVEHWEEDHDGDRSVYFADPNGLMLEVTHRRPRRAAPGASAAAALDVVRRWSRRRG